MCPNCYFVFRVLFRESVRTCSGFTLWMCPLRPPSPFFTMLCWPGLGRASAKGPLFRWEKTRSCEKAEFEVAPFRPLFFKDLRAKNFDRNTVSCASWVLLVHLSLISKCSLLYSGGSGSPLGLAGFPPKHPRKYISYLGSKMSWGGIGGSILYLGRPGALRAP